MAEEKTNVKNYNRRTEKDYGFWRMLFYKTFVTFVVWTVTKFMYNLKIYGRENVPKTSRVIFAGNHVSYLDPPIVSLAVGKCVAYMAKKELFENPFLCWWLNWLGAFAVDRENLSVSTIRTVLTIRKTEWVFGIFPQGKRQEPGTISGITKGFASLAKTTKCGILPVGIVGSQEARHLPFSGKIIVKIGKVIPYSENVDEMVDKWIEEIQKLTGFKVLELEKV